MMTRRLLTRGSLGLIFISDSFTCSWLPGLWEALANEDVRDADGGIELCVNLIMHSYIIMSCRINKQVIIAFVFYG